MRYFCTNFSQIFWEGGIAPSQTPPFALPPLYFQFPDPPLTATVLKVQL